MVSYGCTSISRGVTDVNYKAFWIKPVRGSFPAFSHNLPAKSASSRIRCSWGPHHERRLFSSQAGNPGGSTQPIYNLPRRTQPSDPPKASLTESGLFNYKAPPMTKKPRWWWRVLACLPYLLPFHETWMYAITAYKFLIPLEDFEFVTYPFLRFLGRLPRRFFLWYFIGGYLGIVRRKEWPHFFRFNMCLGLLVEISFHIFGAFNRWMPKGLLHGKIGTFVWTAIVLNHFTTVCGCIFCALWGTYADIPFFSDAAYMQIPQA